VRGRHRSVMNQAGRIRRRFVHPGLDRRTADSPGKR
jgi:hypothetical protein